MTQDVAATVWNMDYDKLRSLWAIAAYHAGRTPDAVAMEYEGRTTTYAQWAARAGAMDMALRNYAPAQGTRIAYLGKNCDHYFSLVAGTSRAGLVLVPLNWRLAPAEWQFILEDAEVQLLIHDEHMAEEATALATALPHLPVVLIDDLGADGAQAAQEMAPPRDDPDEVVLQMYTSGTTGKPKGAMLSNWNLIAQRKPGYMQKMDWYQTDSDVTLVISPIAHVAGTAFASWQLYAGGRIVIAREFSPASTVALINQTGVNFVLFVPSMLQMLLDYLDESGKRLAGLRYIAYGASPMPDAVLARAQAMLPARYVQMYGMTEAGGIATALGPEYHEGDVRPKLRSAGLPFPGGEVAIVDNDGHFLSAEEPGEVVVRSEQVMKGYWKRPDATAEAMLPGGWIRSGDVGRLDEDGFLYVLDRVKDMIISGGENVYPAEVENLLFTHPAIRTAAVIGRPHERWVEEVVAVVVLKSGATLGLEELRSWARGKIAGFKIPRALAIVDALPLSPNGKVLRRQLREMDLPFTS